MKFSTLTFALTLLSSTNAFCNFRLKTANSPDQSINGLYVQTLNDVATLGPPFTNVTASFPDPNITTTSTLGATAAPGQGDWKFMLAPSLGVERIVFAQVPPAGARYTEWSLLSTFTGSTLTYGTGQDRFIVYSPPSSIAHYEIYWVPQGTMFGGVEVDLVAECVEEVGGCNAR